MNTNKYRGFTIIELITVIGIFSMLLSMSILSYHSINQNVALDNTVDEVVNKLRVAQNNALSSQDNKNWGIHFDSSTKKYDLYSGPWPSANISSFNIGTGIEIISVTDSVNNPVENIEFARLLGTTASVEVVIGFPSGKQKTIQLDEIGKISVL